jgi:hypothetical protein
MSADLQAILPPVIMAVLFVAVVRLIIVTQNPAKRAAARERELAAERADPRFTASEGRTGSDPKPGGESVAQ